MGAPSSGDVDNDPAAVPDGGRRGRERVRVVREVAGDALPGRVAAHQPRPHHVRDVLHPVLELLLQRIFFEQDADAHGGRERKGP